MEPIQTPDQDFESYFQNTFKTILRSVLNIYDPAMDSWAQGPGARAELEPPRVNLWWRSLSEAALGVS
jgi:hypothetical protein